MEEKIVLPFRYDFSHALVRLAGDPVNRVSMNEQKVYIPMEARNIVTLQSIGTTDQPMFIVKGFKDDAQYKRILEMFHLDRSLEPVYEHFQKTELHALFDTYAGMPLIQSFTLYGRLMKGIIHQQLNKSFANTLTMRFVETYGEQKDGTWLYPLPEVVAELPVQALRALQFSERKANYVIGLSQAIHKGTLDLEQLRHADEVTIVDTLTQYKGIGPWTAQNFLLFGLGKENLFPIADVGLQNALKKLWQMDRKPSIEEIQSHLPNWEPYLSYAALYLWKSMEVPRG